MERTELLSSILQISCQDEYINQLIDELDVYFNLLTGVIIESGDYLSPYTLGNIRTHLNIV